LATDQALLLFHAKNAKIAKEVDMDVEALATIAVDCGYRIHSKLGPGLLESAYETILASLLVERGLRVERQKLIPIQFEGLVIEEGFRADLVVEGKLLIELKATDRLTPVFGKQVLTYLRFMDLPLGLLMNFGAPTFKEGVKRIINGQSSIPLSLT
jgi:iron complex transport system substrate-binding protein